MPTRAVKTETTRNWKKMSRVWQLIIDEYNTTLEELGEGSPDFLVWMNKVWKPKMKRLSLLYNTAKEKRRREIKTTPATLAQALAFADEIDKEGIENLLAQEEAAGAKDKTRDKELSLDRI